MNEYTLFRNMKRWLFTYGSSLLDLLFPVENYETLDPVERYNQLSELFDKHFNLLAYYASQLQPDLPLILVSFEDITDNSCFREYRIVFDIYFQTISPQDCKDDRYNVCNSPEAILEYRELIDKALCEMMYNMGEDLRTTDFDGEPWEFPINYEVVEENWGQLTGVTGDEILHFRDSFIVSDNESIC